MYDKRSILLYRQHWHNLLQRSVLQTGIVNAGRIGVVLETNLVLAFALLFIN